jgi:hypothetical protein
MKAMWLAVAQAVVDDKSLYDSLTRKEVLSADA